MNKDIINIALKKEENDLKVSHDYHSLIDNFISAQDVKGSSKDTYKRTLKQFFLWISQAGQTRIELMIFDIYGDYSDMVVLRNVLAIFCPYRFDYLILSLFFFCHSVMSSLPIQRAASLHQSRQVLPRLGRSA